MFHLSGCPPPLNQLLIKQPLCRAACFTRTVSTFRLFSHSNSAEIMHSSCLHILYTWHVESKDMLWVAACNKWPRPFFICFESILPLLDTEVVTGLTASAPPRMFVKNYSPIWTEVSYFLFSMEDIASLWLQRCMCLQWSRLEREFYLNSRNKK